MVDPAPSGDSEIDSVRIEAAAHPTQMSNFPYRIAILTTWINLLHRQGADLTEYASIFDQMKTSRDQGDMAALCRGIDAAFVFLNAVQATIEAELRPIWKTAPDTRVDEPEPAFEWAVYGGNPHLTSYTPEDGPVQGAIAWHYPIGLAWYANPAIENGRVYIPVPGIRCLMQCVDLETGESLWQTRRTWTQDSLGIVNLSPSSYVLPGSASTPVILDDVVLVNQLGAQGRNLGDKHILVIDKASGDIVDKIPAGEADYRIGYAPLAANRDFVVYPSGTQRAQERPPQLIGQNRIICKRVDGAEADFWDFHIGPTFCEPVIDGDRIFTANADGMVFCLRLAGVSGEQHFGFSDERRVIWQFNAGAGVNNSPTVTDKYIYLGANQGALYCLEKSTGAIIWQTDLPREPHSFKLFSTPVVAGQHIYLGSASRHLHCLDTQTGALVWSFEADDWVRAAPYVVDERIVFASMRGTVYCLAADGRLQWQTQVGTHPVYANLVGQGNRVLITASDLRVFCLDANTGQIHWTHYLLDQAVLNGRRYQADELACGGWYQSKPTAAGGRVFIGTPSRFVLALDYRTGAEVWRYEVGGAVSAAPAIADGKVFFGQKGEEYFYCLDANTGDLIWKQMTGWVWSSANVYQDGVFVPGSDGYVSCLDAKTGHIRWRYRTGSSTAPEPPIDGGMIFFGSWDHYVYALDTQTGRLIWQFHTGGSPDSGAPIAVDGRVYVPVGGNRLFCLDSETGRIIWEHRVAEGDMNASPALANGRLFISMGVRPGAVPIASRIQCLDAKTGEFIWEHTGGGITGPSVANDRVYFGSTSAPYFYCVDAIGNGDGTTNCLWQVEMGERVYESVPALYGGRAYILNENGYLFAFI